MSRRALAVLISAVVVVAAGFAVSRIIASRSVSQVVAEGRVTTAAGQPVSGIKVWLNAWPNALQADKQQGTVTVAGSAVTSATGQYTIRLSSLAALAPDVSKGVVTFSLMAGNSSGWDMPSFTRDVVSSAGGFGPAVLAIPHGGSLAVNLFLTANGP